jgi:hypothetical protein
MKLNISVVHFMFRSSQGQGLYIYAETGESEKCRRV